MPLTNLCHKKGLVCCHILFTNEVHLYLAQRILTNLETLLMGKVQTSDRNWKFWKELGLGCSSSETLILMPINPKHEIVI